MATQRWNNVGRAMVKVQNLFVSSQVCADFRAILQSLCCVYHDPVGFMDLLWATHNIGEGGVVYMN